MQNNDYVSCLRFKCYFVHQMCSLSGRPPATICYQVIYSTHQFKCFNTVVPHLSRSWYSIENTSFYQKRMRKLFEPGPTFPCGICDAFFNPMNGCLKPTEALNKHFDSPCCVLSIICIAERALYDVIT